MSVKLKILTQHGGSEQEGHHAWNCKCPLVLQTGDGVARAASHSSVTLAQSSAGWPETDPSSRFLLNCNCPIYLFWLLFSFFLPHPHWPWIPLCHLWLKSLSLSYLILSAEGRDCSQQKRLWSGMCIDENLAIQYASRYWGFNILQ